MEKDITMRPYDCQPLERNEDSTNNVESMIYSFNVRQPLIQLKFNDHDCYHRRSCFKKSLEYQMDLPHQHRLITKIYFDKDKDNNINWYFID